MKFRRIVITSLQAMVCIAVIAGSALAQTNQQQQVSSRGSWVDSHQQAAPNAGMLEPDSQSRSADASNWRPQSNLQTQYNGSPYQTRPIGQTHSPCTPLLQGQLEQTNVAQPNPSWSQWNQPARIRSQAEVSPGPLGQNLQPYIQQQANLAPLQQVLTRPLQGVVQGNGGVPFQLTAPYNSMQPWTPSQAGIPQFPRQAPFEPAGRDGHPKWIPLYAYTNDNMVAPYHALNICWWNKSPIPNRPSTAGLSTSVSRYWGGYVPQPCFISIMPVPEAPGNFTFQCTEPNGPRGWLQYLDAPDRSGFPRYRYWLDQH